jgi:hypothetical protein
MESDEESNNFLLLTTKFIILFTVDFFQIKLKVYFNKYRDGKRLVKLKGGKTTK